jgi:hypothetical protein
MEAGAGSLGSVDCAPLIRADGRPAGLNRGTPCGCLGRSRALCGLTTKAPDDAPGHREPPCGSPTSTRKPGPVYLVDALARSTQAASDTTTGPPLGRFHGDVAAALMRGPACRSLIVGRSARSPARQTPMPDSTLPTWGQCRDGSPLLRAADRGCQKGSRSSRCAERQPRNGSAGWQAPAVRGGPRRVLRSMASTYEASGTSLMSTRATPGAPSEKGFRAKALQGRSIVPHPQIRSASGKVVEMLAFKHSGANAPQDAFDNAEGRS